MSDSHLSEKPATGAESNVQASALEHGDKSQELNSAAHETSSMQTPKSPSPKPKVSFQEDEPPAKPPRPMSPQAQAEGTLIEAFPSIDVKVVKAVLVASAGKAEPAFNALLSMSDPDFQDEEPAPPPKPPRPTQAQRESQRQLEADEMYARQLAEHYQNPRRQERPPGYGSQQRGDPPLPRRPQNTNLKPNELYDDDKEHSFFDDDLPVIKENVRKGFLETQTKVNRWISDFRKKIDGEDDYDPLNGPPGPSTQRQRQNFGPSQSQQMYGIRKSADLGRRSGDRERYDSDPHVLSDDFTALELRDEEGNQSGRETAAGYRGSHLPTAAPQRRSNQNRSLANPDLFKPTPLAPQSGPVDEVDALYRSSTPTKKSAKWQPLTSVAPHPESDDNDPFSLDDSDEERETKSKDLRAEDSDRLKKAAESTSEDTGSGSKKKELRSAERSGSMGTRDKEAEELLSGKP
ncbi:hypothetical protein B0A49_09423 [Cryomyces minteri]|uniref:CUE domain-containing protein n=1 Tax=Cryomyces minteri TaxID=331657 RepID=A0A4U0WH43_9PEZI|nr:hypothetical protein B0A49_09423 [Cryomyces minteri]